MGQARGKSVDGSRNTRLAAWWKDLLEETVLLVLVVLLGELIRAGRK